MQGLGNPDTVNALWKIANKVSLYLVFLSETRLDEAWAESIKWKMGFASGFVVDCVGRVVVCCYSGRMTGM